MEDEDVWVPITEFPQYLINKQGHILHTDRTKTRKPQVNNRGFPTVVLYSPDGHGRFLRQLNILVATEFVPRPADPERPDRVDPKATAVWHIDGNLLNCSADNLKWETRPKVLEWNEMHRTMAPKFKTPLVKDNTTGEVYENAFECAMALGVLESHILWKIERQAWDMFDEEADFRYVTPSYPA